MIFSQVINEDLGCASYLLGDGGEAVVVDPRLDIDVYLAAAAEEECGSSPCSTPTSTPTTSRGASDSPR